MPEQLQPNDEGKWQQHFDKNSDAAKQCPAHDNESSRDGANEEKGKEQRNRLKGIVFGASLTDWLLALFTGALVVLAYLQYRALEEANASADSASKAAAEATKASQQTAVATQKVAGEMVKLSDQSKRSIELSDNANKTAEKAANALKDAAVATKKAADAADKQTGITSDIGERFLRSYLSAKTTSLQVGPLNTNVSAVVNMVNDGLTPAHQIISTTNMIVQPHGYKGPFELGPAQNSEANGMTIGPRGEYGLQLTLLPALNTQQIAGVNARTLVIWIFGEIHYRDAFGKKHTTNFRFVQGKSLGASTYSINYADGGNDSD